MINDPFPLKIKRPGTTPISWAEYDKRRDELFNQEAYNEGLGALRHDPNPHTPKSPNWYSWNKGKNDRHDDPETLEKNVEKWRKSPKRQK